MIILMLCVTIFVILVVWFLLPRIARLMIHTPTAISIFVCLSMVQLMAVFISMRCTLCGHFLQVAFFFQAEVGIRNGTVTGVQTCALPILRPVVVLGLLAIGATTALLLLVDQRTPLWTIAVMMAGRGLGIGLVIQPLLLAMLSGLAERSEERRVGKECSAGWAADGLYKKKT